MKQHREVKSPRARPRVAPPVATPDSLEGIDGIACMLELEGEAGFLLWRTLRNVRLWASTPAASRSGLFVPEAYDRRVAEILTLDLGAQPHDAFMGLAAVLRGGQGPPPRTVAMNCLLLARWAESRGMQVAALELAHAAAIACPEDAYFALQAGRQARDLARHALAEGWLQRAVVVAREMADWHTYARAHIAFGYMLNTRGNFRGARRHLQRAAARCR